jgi:hypothetical protein
MEREKEIARLYKPSATACEIVDVPKMRFLMIDGSGDPNTSHEFQEAIQALYGVSYTLKFTLKKSGGPEFRVAPLEALWWSDASGRLDASDKAGWSWTAMLRQPDFVEPAAIADATAQAKAKRELPALPKMRFETFREGLSAQIMHVGPYAAETPTIEKLHAFIAEQGCEPVGKHHEIYLGDPRRAAPEKLKTVIRQPIRRIQA